MAGGVTGWRDVLELAVDVQMAVDPTSGRWDQARWGVDTWAGGGPGWAPVECDDLLTLTFGLTRSSLADNHGAGQLSMTVRNAGGWASGQPGVDHVGVLPGVPLRVRVRPIAGTWVTIWTGEVDGITTRWDPDGACLTSLVAVDTMAALAVVDPPETAVPLETSSERLARIAGLTGRAGLTFRNLSGLEDWIKAGTLAQQLVSEALLTVNTTGGTLAASPSTPKRILWIDSDMNSVPTIATLVVTNRPATAGTVVVCPLTFASDGPDVAEVSNHVTIHSTTVQDTASIDAYGVRTWGRSDLLMAYAPPTGYGATLANRHLGYRSMPRPSYRVTYSVPDSLQSPAQLASWVNRCTHVYGRAEVTPTDSEKHAQAVRIAWDGGASPDTGAPWPIDVYGRAVGISHAVTPQSWVVAMDVDVPAPAAAATSRPAPLEAVEAAQLEAVDA